MFCITQKNPKTKITNSTNAGIGLLAAVLCYFLPFETLADGCGALVQTPASVPVTASAALLSNAANRPGSLRYESNRILTHEFETPFPPRLLCPHPCNCEQMTHTVFSSVPNKFLKEYEDRAFCEEMLSKTSETPLLFEGKQFKTLQDLSSWVGDFSQGKGEDGAVLYEKCPRSCSPQFFYTISRRQSGPFEASARVLCGHARDKDDNQYLLTVSTEWSWADKR